MLQLQNKTPFLAQLALFPNAQAIDTLYVAVKGSFSLHPTLDVAPEQVPLCLADVCFGEPGQSSIKYAAEMHLAKPGTDVVLVGHAWPPQGRALRGLDVQVSVADRAKTVRVFGERTWLRDGRASSPEPFDFMPLVYERAYGGVQREEGGDAVLSAETRNPVGAGFRGRRAPTAMTGQALPNLEDPRTLIQTLDDQPAPASFGFIAPHWLPRARYAGTYDATWQQQRAPYLPLDFDSKFFNAAHPDLSFERYLAGGEPVLVVNASRHGALGFSLPVCEIAAVARIAGRTVPMQLNLETVLIEPDENRLCMTWRAALTCDKQALRIERVSLDLTALKMAA